MSRCGRARPGRRTAVRWDRRRQTAHIGRSSITDAAWLLSPKRSFDEFRRKSLATRPTLGRFDHSQAESGMAAYAESSRSRSRTLIRQDPIGARWHFFAPKSDDTGTAGRRPIIRLEPFPPVKQSRTT